MNKFRAWHKTQKKMMEIRIWDFEGLSLLKSGDRLIQARPHHFEVLQFIGLLDKNGIKIFEGDIIKNSQNNKIYVVIFRYHGFYFRRLGQKGMAHIPEAEMEVVGNVFENANLLGSYKDVYERF